LTKPPTHVIINTTKQHEKGFNTMSETTKKTKTVTGIATISLHDSENQVLSAKGFQAEMARRATDLQGDTGIFDEWLIDVKDLSVSEIFNMTKAERDKVWQEYDEYCAKLAKDELLENWSEYEIEVEVEVEC
jgi:hypothetical protein